MKPIVIEVVIVLVILFVILAVILIPRIKKWLRRKNIATIGVVILTLVETFIVIHILFCYQVGFPASVTQDPSIDLTLSSADWLGFLGGYLGFSGSLVMAYLVYRQSKTIDELTISEYKPSASMIIQRCINSSEYEENGETFLETNIIQNIPGNTKEQYYSYHCDLTTEGDIQYESFANLVFVEIANNSKTPIKNLSFLGIEVIEIKARDRQFAYVNRGGTWDPADKETEILPGRRIKRCFVLERIPEEIDISWMTIKFFYGDQVPFDTKVLVSKRRGEVMTFLSVSE